MISSPNPSEQPSLYDRIGGEDGIRRLVDDFYARVSADPALKPFFDHVPMDKLLHMQREFFGAATGGPIVYSGRPVGQVHRNKGITKSHFKHFTDHLLETLGKFDLSDEDVRTVIARVNLYADEVTGDGPMIG